MEIQRQNGTLTVRGALELSTAAARRFQNAICDALDGDLKCVEIDLSQTGAVDSCGLAALLSIHETANSRNRDGVVLRLLSPQPQVLQVIELTRLYHLFELVPQTWLSEASPAGAVRSAEPQRT